MMHQTCISCSVKSNGMIAIYQHPNGLDVMFRTVTDVEVQPEDHLCVPCYDDMKIAYRFKQKCRQNVGLRATHQTQRTQPPSEQSANSSTDVSTTVSEPLSSKYEISKKDSTKDIKSPAAVQQEVELILDNDNLQDDAEISFGMVDQEQDDTANVLEEVKKCDSDSDSTTSDEPKQIAKEECSNTIKHLSDEQPSTSTALDGENLKQDFLSRLPKVHSLMCEYCFKEFEVLTDKIEHTETHQTESKPFKCAQDGCGGAFKDRVGLRAHVRIHATIKRYGCRYCSMRFHTLGNRNAHERTHNGEKPFICPKCGKGFAEGGNLKNHIRFHDGERPYTCGVCSKSYRTHYSRAVHMRSHTNDRPFVCNDCGKGFYSSGKLTIHRRTHTGERPYECESCTAKFSNTCGLRRHMAKRH